MPFLFPRRPRRNRKSPSIRALVQETQLVPEQLIAPAFVLPQGRGEESIPSLPGVYRQDQEHLAKEVESLLKEGVCTLILFPCIPQEKKDLAASLAVHPQGLIPQTLLFLKERFPEMTLIAHLALDPFTSHGHDGILSSSGEILNDETLRCLMEMALVHAQAGADILAPSDMMDGRVHAIRSALDKAAYSHTSILSYAAKYASSLYSPFRDALGSQMLKGDKRSYQMSPYNQKEALMEAELDEEEGADMLLVKPGTLYLDVLHRVCESTLLPVGSYHVSGEYAMIAAAAEKGWIDFDAVLLETLIAMRRAGARFIISYGAKRAAQILQQKAWH